MLPQKVNLTKLLSLDAEIVAALRVVLENTVYTVVQNYNKYINIIKH